MREQDFKLYHWYSNTSMVFLGVSYSIQIPRGFSHIPIAQQNVKKVIGCKTYSVTKIISSNFTLSV